MTQNDTNSSSKPPLNPLAALLVASGGSVVGHDYARTFDVSPLGGAALGGIVSVILLGIFNYVYKDPDKHIKEFLEIAGFFAFAYFGYISVSNDTSSSSPAWLVALIMGAIGAFVGRAAASALSIIALALLFLSQGPAGLLFRTYVLNMN